MAREFITKKILAEHAVVLTDFWFTLSERDMDVRMMIDKIVRPICTAPLNTDQVELGSFDFYHNAQRNDIINFIRTINKALNKELKKLRR